MAYSLKVVLDNSRPLIWRRILVPDISLESLHDVIQIAFGWKDAHLHGFEVKNVHVPSVEDGERIDERGISVAQLHTARIKKFHYTYDFGDSWEREADDPNYFYRFSVDGYAFGINVLLYALSH